MQCSYQFPGLRELILRVNDLGINALFILDILIIPGSRRQRVGLQLDQVDLQILIPACCIDISVIGIHRRVFVHAHSAPVLHRIGDLVHGIVICRCLLIPCGQLGKYRVVLRHKDGVLLQIVVIILFKKPFDCVHGIVECSISCAVCHRSVLWCYVAACVAVTVANRDRLKSLELPYWVLS